MKKEIGATRSLGLGILFCFSYAFLIWFVSPMLPKVNFAPDTGFSHYFWKLPDPTFWTRATAWTGYLLHQTFIWALIWRAQKQKLATTDKLHSINLLALGANAFFVLLHLGQTHLTYDGLAQDVPIWTSQGSVILLLVIVLAMENSRRGLFFGHRAPMPKEGIRALRKYHGFVFSWAVIFTFWFHPMLGTSGHLLGTIYTALLMLQGSLFFTRAHKNRYWTGSLEVLVLVHGTMVSVMQGNEMWPMFLFGFAAIFIVTQMHGLGFPRWLRWAFVISYGAGVVSVYGLLRSDWVSISEVFRIPVIEYLLAFIVALIAWGLAVAYSLIHKNVSTEDIQKNKAKIQ